MLKPSEVTTLFLDRDLHIKSYTPQDTWFLDVGETDIGRIFSGVVHGKTHFDLKRDARKVLNDVETITRELPHENGCLHIRLSPSYSASDNVGGIVITFIDITDIIETRKLFQKEKEFAELLLNTVREGLLVLDDNLQVKSGNASFFRLFQVDKEKTVGSYVYELGNNQWDIPELRKLLQEILPESKVVNDFEIEHEFERIGHRIMLLNARQIDHLQLILLAIEDVTDRKEAIRELYEVNATLEEHVEKATRQVRKLVSRLTRSEQEERRRISHILHDELQQILFALQMTLNFIHKKIKPDTNGHLSEQITEALEMTGQAIEKTRQLTGDLNPVILKSSSLNDLLKWIADRFEDMYDLKTELKTNSNLVIHSEEKRMMLLQILRELLFNIVKHANAESATIEIHEKSDGNFVIKIIDDGCGFDVDASNFKIENRKGFGLFNIHDRLELFGGSLDINSTPGSGTCVTIVVPE